MAYTGGLLTRKTLLQVKVETTKGTFIAVDTDVWAVGDSLVCRPDAEFEERKGTAKKLGNTSPGVIGQRSGVCEFTTELKGTDAGGLDAGLAALLQACGCLKTLEVYTPESEFATCKTVSIAVSEDGVKKTLAGCMGNARFHGEAGGRVMIDFSFKGRWITPTDVALPTNAYSAIIPARLNSSSGTFTIAAAAMKVGAFAFDLGNQVELRDDIVADGGIASAIITDRSPTFECDPEFDLVANYDFYGAWLAGTEVAVALTVTNGTDSFALAIPKYQYRELAPSNRKLIRTLDMTGQCNINAIDTGDDEWSLTVS